MRYGHGEKDMANLIKREDFLLLHIFKEIEYLWQSEIIRRRY